MPVYYFSLMAIGFGMDLLELTRPQKSFNFMQNDSCILEVTILLWHCNRPSFMDGKALISLPEGDTHFNIPSYPELGSCF